jgi:hypothetical protein
MTRRAGGAWAGSSAPSFGIEIVVIFAVSNILSALGLDRLILAAIAVVVGLHFLPLAALFRVAVHYVTG